MIVTCEECGKRYRIDPEKIKIKTARFKCRACNHVIIVSKPETRHLEPSSLTAIKRHPDQVVEKRPPAEPEEKKKAPKKKEQKRKSPKLRRLGLRGKMLLLFLIIPILLMSGASLFYLRQLNNLSSLITRESSVLVKQFAEQTIAEKARTVASQVRLYLLSHPDLKKEDFNKDTEFKTLAVQKIGMKGYTALYELPGPDGIWRTWSHVNTKIIAIDMSKLKKPLGRNFPGFWKIYIGVKDGKRSQGYYTWQDKDGRFRDKFMACTPVDGTPYVIASTTYLDEFTRPITKLERRSEELRKNTMNIIIAILVFTLILVGLVVFLYAYRLTNNIRYLSQIAERISIGELEAEIEIRSKDEIGDLGNSVARMQDSIRLSIERLRRKR